ncbi:DUF2065 domain-containing protein [Thiobacillus sp.]
MTGSDCLAAVGLMLVIEGFLPFVLPGVWRNASRRMLELRDGQLRFIGATAMLGGLFVLMLLN